MGHATARETHSSRLPRPVLVAATLAALIGAGCGDGATEPPPPPPNRAPVASGSIPAQTVAVDATATVNVAGYFSDPDGNALTYAATSSNAAVVSVSVAGSVVTLGGVAAGTATVTVTARDSGGLSAQLSFAVEVPNRAPVPVGTIAAHTLAVGQDSTIDVSPYFEDPDGDALTFAGESGDSDVASAALSGSLLTVTALARGTVSVTVTATDSGGLSAQQSFEVTVPNQAPVTGGAVPAQTVFVGETASVDLSSHFSDPDGDTLTYSAATSDAAVASASVAGDMLSLEGVAQGEATVTVTATDGGGLSAQLSFAVEVPNRAPAPVGSLAVQTLEVGQSIAVDVLAYFDDPDGDSLVYAAESSDAAAASATMSGSVLTVTALARGTASVTVTASDPGDLSAEQSFEVTVPNQAPVVRDSIQSGTLSVGQSAGWSGPELFGDPDGDSLTYAAASTNVQIVRPWITEDVLLGGRRFRRDGDGDLPCRRPRRAVRPHRVRRYGAEGERRHDQQHESCAVLVEGASATIHGSGFSTTASRNQVTVGGLAARVTAATGTSLTIQVPYADCLPPRRAQLRVTVGSDSGSRNVGVTPRTPDDLALPEGWYRYTYGGNGCLHLPGNASGGEFLIGVSSISEDPSSLTGFTLTSTSGDGTVAGAELGGAFVADALGLEEGTMEMEGFEVRPAGLAAAAPSPGGAGFAAPFPTADTLHLRWAQAHNEMMARNEELVRRLGRSTPPALDRAQSRCPGGRHAHPGRLDVLQRVARGAGDCEAGGGSLRVAGGHRESQRVLHRRGAGRIRGVLRFLRQRGPRPVLRADLRRGRQRSDSRSHDQGSESRGGSWRMVLVRRSLPAQPVSRRAMSRRSRTSGSRTRLANTGTR